jgi:hypothetical protein
MSAVPIQLRRHSRLTPDDVLSFQAEGGHYIGYALAWVRPVEERSAAWQ